MSIFDWLNFPFVQRAVIAGVILAALSGFLGVFMSIRRSTFFGEAIAHSALAGVAFAFLLNIHPLFGAFAYALLFSALIPVIRKAANLSIDSVLGILLPFSMGLGVLVFSLLPSAQPQLMSYLFGSMLMIRWSDIWVLCLASMSIILFLFFFFRHWLLLSLDEEYARLLGVRVKLHDFLYHFFLAMVVILGVRLVGVVLVTTLLVVPVSIARFFAKSLHQVFFLAPLLGMATVLAGIGISLIWNIPTGASIAVFAGGFFFLTLLIFSFKKN